MNQSKLVRVTNLIHISDIQDDDAFTADTRCGRTLDKPIPVREVTRAFRLCDKCGTYQTHKQVFERWQEEIGANDE